MQLLHSGNLRELLHATQTALPDTLNSIHTCVRNAYYGRVEGNFYTDGWPWFTTVVFQCTFPRLSDIADLNCHSTSKDRLLAVLQEVGLVTFHKQQVIQVSESEDMASFNHLMQDLSPGGGEGIRHCSMDEVGHYVLQDKAQLELHTSAACPEGYVVGVLRPEHSEFIASQSHWINSFGLSTREVVDYIKRCIQKFENVAIFTTPDSDSLPVSWVMQYAYSGMTANLYTHPQHRQRGLGRIVQAVISKQILEMGCPPDGQVADGNLSAQTILVQQLGYRRVGRVRTFYLNFDSKSL